MPSHAGKPYQPKEGRLKTIRESDTLATIVDFISLPPGHPRHWLPISQQIINSEQTTRPGPGRQLKVPEHPAQPEHFPFLHVGILTTSEPLRKMIRRLRTNTAQPMARKSAAVNCSFTSPCRSQIMKFTSDPSDQKEENRYFTSLLQPSLAFTGFPFPSLVFFRLSWTLFWTL